MILRKFEEQKELETLVVQTFNDDSSFFSGKARFEKNRPCPSDNMFEIIIESVNDFGNISFLPLYLQVTYISVSVFRCKSLNFSYRANRKTDSKRYRVSFNT